MFTGIIEEIGTVKQLVPGKVSYRLTVKYWKGLRSATALRLTVSV